ncbi:MAG: hypothetical protein WDN06_17450 [Asticcacaulis sp.]
MNATTTYDYDPFGDVKTVYDPLLVKTARTYSGRGLLLTSTVDSGATGHLALKTSYLYDAFAGSLRSPTRTMSSVRRPISAPATSKRRSTGILRPPVSPTTPSVTS